MSNSRNELDSLHSNGLVVWTCPEKHPHRTGFLTPLASTLRFCQHVTGWDGTAEVYCGAQLEVCYDERIKPPGPLSQAATDDEKRLRVAGALRQAQKNLLEGQMMAAEIVEQLGIALKGIRKAGK